MSLLNHLPQFSLPYFILSSPLLSILLPITGGSAIGLLTRNPDVTYNALKRPPLHPPAWLFGPVWTLLYGMMGYAAHRAHQVGMVSLNPTVNALARQGNTLYATSLFLNFVWMPLFFGYNHPKVALADIILLTGNVGALIHIYFQLDEPAGWMMSPYIAWLSFATYICAGTGYLNGWDILGKKKERQQ